MRAGPRPGLGPSLHTIHPLSKILKIEGLEFLSLYDRPSLPPAGRNLQQLKILDFLSLDGGPSLCLAGRTPNTSKILDLLSLYGGSSTIKYLGFLKPQWRAVVASGGSKSSQSEGLGFFEPPWPTVVASGRSKSSNLQANSSAADLSKPSVLR